MPPPLAVALSASFQVDWGEPGQEGFAQVIFPRLLVADQMDPLVLVRAVTSDRSLFLWWQGVLAGRTRRMARTVIVTALDRMTGEPIAQWRFREARPVAFRHSPLDAGDGGLLLESLELAFASVDRPI